MVDWLTSYVYEIRECPVSHVTKAIDKDDVEAFD